MEFLVGAMLVAGCGWILWAAFGPRTICVIAVKSGHVQIRGPIAARRAAEITEFFAAHFPETGRLRVTVLAPSTAGRSRIRIRGDVNDGDKQAIRNFLLTRL